VRVLTLEGSPYGIVLTHDERTLVVASDDRVAFVDVPKLITGSTDAVLGYLTDAPLAGRFYVNITRDDRWVFVSDESERSISVIDLRRAQASRFAASSVIRRIQTGRAPIALTFSPDYRLLYTTSQEAPASLRWPAICRAPGSDTARFQNKYPQGMVTAINVQRAITQSENPVVGFAAAGCNPVRLAISPEGDKVYVTARTDNELLVFDTKALLSDSPYSLVGRVPVGSAPVGVTTVKSGQWIAVTNSNRFGESNAPPSMTFIDATQITRGAAAVLGTMPTGAFPREMTVTRDQRTVLLTNFDSKTLAVIDVARIAERLHKFPSSVGRLTNVAADKHFSDAASPQW
jgi:DNA-binding beta-propeller fold protein YncE